jgi:Cd2+/Zn2+-exporting ATPase/Cu+-exporting ATPase
MVKTGTLTAGAPEILAMAPEPGHTDTDLLTAAAVAECRSEHPLAKAILARADQMGLPPEEPAWFESISGGGIAARSQAGDILVGSEPFLTGRGVQVHAAEAPGGRAASAVHVAVNGTHVGRIWIADLARKEAKAAIHHIHDLGIRTILLTGDGSRAAQALGQELGIDQVEAGPQGRQQRQS